MADPEHDHAPNSFARIAKGASVSCVLLLGACSVGSFLEATPPSDPVAEPAYRRLISSGIPRLLPGMPATAIMGVSKLRRTVPVQPGDWIACLRRSAGKETAFFAVFFKDHKIETVRRAVLVDRCEEDTYSPLAKLTPPKKQSSSKTSDAFAEEAPAKCRELEIRQTLHGVPALAIVVVRATIRRPEPGG